MDRTINERMMMRNANDEAKSCSDSGRQARIQQMKNELQIMAGGKAVVGTMEGCPPEVEEQFLKQVLDFERQEKVKRN
jgi:hypothetical protein